MARKAVTGYAEKNYYDNTRFSGINAVGDELNEGQFKHLVNFDIADTGRSLSPRKGFLTTSIHQDIIKTLSDKTIYFQDAASGKYIFIDFYNTEYTYTAAQEINGVKNVPAYVGDLIVNNESYITVDKINFNYIDADNFSCDFLDLVEHIKGFANLQYIVPVESARADSVYDHLGVRRNLIKLSLTKEGIIDPFWLEIVYKKDKTLLLTVVPLDDIVSIDLNYRNLASRNSIIPEPIQHVYSKDKVPDGFYNQFPMIYAKQDDKYIINNLKTLKDVSIIPHFILEEAPVNYEWLYTYDIINTGISDKYIYRAPVFRYDDNTVYPTENFFAKEIHNLFKNSLRNVYNRESYYGTPSTSRYFDYHNSSLNNYTAYLEQLYLDPSSKYFGSTESKNSVVMYIVPKTPEEHIECTNSYHTDGLDRNLTVAESLHGLFGGNRYSSIYEEKYEWDNSIVQATIDSKQNNGRAVTFLSSYIQDLCTKSYNVLDLLDKLSPYTASIDIYIIPVSEITYTTVTSKGMCFASSTAFCSNFMCMPGIKSYSIGEARKYFTDTVSGAYVRLFYTATSVDFSGVFSASDFGSVSGANFMNIFGVSEDDPIRTIYTSYQLSELPQGLEDSYVTHYYQMFKRIHEDDNGTVTYDNPLLVNSIPYWYSYNSDEPTEHKQQSVYLMNPEGVKGIYEQESLFYKPNDTLVWEYSNGGVVSQKLQNANFFSQGLYLTFYLCLAPTHSFLNTSDFIGMYDDISREALVASTSLYTSLQLHLSTDDPTYITERLEDEPDEIRNFKNSLIFRETSGDRLIVYEGNKLYMSEASRYYYFIDDGVFEFPERIVKVIQYKDTLLVFTVQNLYSIYPYELTELVDAGVDDNGNPKTVQNTKIVYNKLPVLYNLMVDENYKEAIQVFNQMVLFYSSDGQMFMIKPTATIDNNTRFSVQYFNKSANDILLNYDEYINRRLEVYGKPFVTKDEIKIKVLVSLNHIKIFYNVPDVITYILIYDIINNCYYTYDSTSFADIQDVFFIQENEMYISHKDEHTYFTIPYSAPLEVDLNVDKAIYYDFSGEAINCEIDSGNINLNNHLKKRFKTLHTIYKNLNATSLEFVPETFVDDIPIYTALGTHLEVKDIGGTKSYESVEHSNKVDLLDNNTALFNFLDYTSNKIITHKSNSVSKGKTFRVRLRFKSKGKYKLQGFGIIYKEHRI